MSRVHTWIRPKVRVKGVRCLAGGWLNLLANLGDVLGFDSIDGSMPKDVVIQTSPGSNEELSMDQYPVRSFSCKDILTSAVAWELLATLLVRSLISCRYRGGRTIDVRSRDGRVKRV